MPAYLCVVTKSIEPQEDTFGDFQIRLNNLQPHVAETIFMQHEVACRGNLKIFKLKDFKIVSM